MGIDSRLVSGGKVLAGARQEQPMSTPNKAFALLCDMSRNVTRDSNVTQSRNVTREGNAV